MSNINKLQEVQSITFNDVSELDTIKNALDKIDENFEHIASSDYLKGATGESMFIQTVDLKEGEDAIDLYKSDDTFVAICKTKT